jgi:hypothetical protein
MPLTDEERALAKQLLAECRHKFTHEERVENGKKFGHIGGSKSTPAKKKAAKAASKKRVKVLLDRDPEYFIKLASMGRAAGAGRKGGASRSEAKAAAARANLKKANEAKRKAQPPTLFVPDI